LRPSELRAVYTAAADLLTYPEIKEFLAEKLEPQFQELAMRLCLILVSSSIASLSSLEERRAIIDTYPEDDAGLDGIRDEVKLGVQRIWKRRQPSNLGDKNDRSRKSSGAEGQRRVPSQRGLELL
jgi:hypothetical protein